WLTALSYKLFGFTELATRFFPALAGVGVVLLLYGIGRRLFSWYVGFWAALLFALSPIFLDYHMARSGDHDVLFLFWLILAIYLYIRTYEKGREWLLVFSGIAAGFAIFTRGALGIFAFAIPFATHILLVIKSHIRKTPLDYTYRWYHSALWAISFLAIGGAWHLYAYIAYGQQFIDIYVKEQFFSRIGAPLQGHSGPWWFYARYLWQTEPFVTVAAAIMAAWWICRYSVALVALGRIRRIRFTAAIILLLVWAVSFEFVISAMSTKLHWYALGMAPALYLIAVSALKHNGVPRAFATLGVVALLVFYAWQLPHRKPQEPLPIQNIAHALKQENVAGTVIIYETALWNFGRILPSFYWYVKYQGGVEPIAVDKNNLEHYLDRSEFGVWITDMEHAADFEPYGAHGRRIVTVDN
ncbi:MAG TPA: glycosyltransferase family 39 protein, partial [Methylophilaceae bacterium]|nr:glycosyltransferase family 39 protein [Methylophilaceae bacterium]